MTSAAPTIVNRQCRVPLSLARLTHATRRALAAVGRPRSHVEILVVDDTEIARLNARFLDEERPTDVLAFPLEAPGPGGGLLGQVVISAESAQRQARRLRVPVALEMDLLATHAVLHLVGYDDREPLEAAVMHQRERQILETGPPVPARLWKGLLS